MLYTAVTRTALSLSTRPEYDPLRMLYQILVSFKLYCFLISDETAHSNDSKAELERMLEVLRTEFVGRGVLEV